MKGWLPIISLFITLILAGACTDNAVPDDAPKVFTETDSTAAYVDLDSAVQSYEDTSIVVTDSSPTAGYYDSSDESNYEDEAGQAPVRPYIVPDTLAFREVPASEVAALKKKKEFEYANDPAYWQEEKKEYSESFLDKFFRFFQNKAVRNFLFVLLILFVLYVIARLVISNNLLVFNRRSRKRSGSGDPEDETQLNAESIDDRLRKALAEKDQRGAVRYLYLKTLQLLDRKGWIVYHPETTNHAYRSQVNRFAKGREFEFLCSVYEYVWYGEFEMNEQQFDKVLHNFTHFQNSLKV